MQTSVRASEGRGRRFFAAFFFVGGGGAANHQNTRRKMGALLGGGRGIKKNPTIQGGPLKEIDQVSIPLGRRSQGRMRESALGGCAGAKQRPIDIRTS